MSVDAVLTNRYWWRGIRRADHGIAQLRGIVRFGQGVTRVNVGAWSNLELSAHRDGSRTDLEPGRRGLSEANGWIELTSATRGGAAVAVGLIGYHYRGASGTAETAEAYLRIRATEGQGIRVVPEVSLFFDPVARNAGYLEAGVSAAGLALPFVEPVALLYSSLMAGVALGRGDGGPKLRSTWFERSGFAVGAATTGIRLRTGSLLFNVAGHLVYGNDPATRRSNRPAPAIRSRLQGLVTGEIGLTLPRPVAR